LNFSKNIALKDISDLISGSWYGNEHVVISGINEIHKVSEGDIVFVDHPKYYDKALQSAASVIIINELTEIPEGKAIIVVKDPFSAFNLITKSFSEPVLWEQANAQIGQNSNIAPGVILGKNVKIGDGCTIHPGVVIYDHTRIGNDTIIHANTVIGADAFYFKKRELGYEKMHTCGTVRIGNQVEIGPSCTIDRGVSNETRIGDGTKLDAQVHVGHDSVIGKFCLIAAQVGIAGCCTLEDNVTLWGQVGLASEVHVKSGAVVLGKAGLMGTLEGNKRKLPEIIEELQK